MISAVVSGIDLRPVLARERGSERRLIERRAGEREVARVVRAAEHERQAARSASCAVLASSSTAA